VSIRWEEIREDGWFAYSGEAIIGHIARRSLGEWAYKIDGVEVKWIGKATGAVASEAEAKRAVEATWADWLKHAGLISA
jgi:hypothetical protein